MRQALKSADAFNLLEFKRAFPVQDWLFFYL
jgi:hypothetical protein